MRLTIATWLLVVALQCFTAQTLAADIDEFNIKRENLFEFAQKPVVTREGDRVTIAFETKGFCDVTVAVEGAGAKIVRHLASGVLGPNAPEPFQKNSKEQVVVWDGKNEQGVYIDDKDSLTVRVSLGLKAQYERSLLWSPYRRVGGNTPAICPAPEGVYVFEGSGFDHLRLFDHEGKYVRTVYPFPADKIDAVQGVKRHVMPQSGQDLPRKAGMRQSTLLTSGYTGVELKVVPDDGAATLAMAVWKDRLFLPGLSLNRLGTDGSSGGMALEGPKTAIPYPTKWLKVPAFPPRSAAVSPDGKTLYLAGFMMFEQFLGDQSRFRCMQGVAQMDPEGKDPPREFVGVLKEGKDHGGTDNAHFRMPASVACDAQGNVYVADHWNDRVQVFKPDGTHIKTIPVNKPAQVSIHHKTGDIYVFSWVLHGPYEEEGARVPAMMHHFGPLSNPREISSCPLPLRRYRGTNYAFDHGGFQFRAALDSWTEPPTIWLVPTTPNRILAPPSWPEAGLLLLTEKEGKLELKRDFTQEGAQARPGPEAMSPRPRLYVQPKTGRLYVGEGTLSFHSLIEIDPATGRQRLVQLPFDTEDLAFDMDGLAYLRTHSEIARYDPATWEEVPFDYGEERGQIGVPLAMGGRTGPAVAAIIGLRTDRGWHQGGLSVSPKGHIAAAFYRTSRKPDRRSERVVQDNAGRPYAPIMYPGRSATPTGSAIVNVWDKHGRLVTADAIPGLGVLDGLAMDKNDDLYVLAASTRILDGTRYFDSLTGTAMKFRFGKAKVLTSAGDVPIPLPAEAAPTRRQEIVGGGLGPAWAEGAQWFYGGLGYNGFHPDMGGCQCWNSRFSLDYFARSFWPEIGHYSVAVLDTNGNLILRIGRYGNVDDGKPLVAEAGPPNPRSIGRDEVGLFYPAYLATHTDRRLFIADPGNARIVSVKLDHHATERVALRDVKESK